MRLFGRALATAWVVAMAVPAIAQTYGWQGAAMHAGTPYGRACDRAAVRACHADARLAVTAACEPFPGRLACADRVLAEQSRCLAASGCD